MVASRIIDSVLQATKVWNPSDPVPTEDDTIEARGKVKKRKGTDNGHGKGRGTSISWNRARTHANGVDTLQNVANQTYPQHPLGLFPRQTHAERRVLVDSAHEVHLDGSNAR